MPCFRPLKAYRRPGGGPPAWSPVEGYHDRPLELACGQCTGCRIQRSADWAARCVHEAQLHPANCFVTLTYAPEHLRSQSLEISDLQKFMKRLRKQHGRVRYFACGEYGEENGRPHFHALLFGQDFCGDGPLVKSKPHRLWRSRKLEETWSLGAVTVGALTYETAAYCARYVIKKVTGERAKWHYRLVDPLTGEVEEIRPEFSTMSRRPGIGAEWIERFRGDVYPSDEVVIDGRRHRPPRFYDERLSEEERDALKRRRRHRVLRRSEELTDDRLRVREKVLESRLESFRRDL